jgi:redox-sensitive bicupin YhaK (pirin superfamily)
MSHFHLDDPVPGDAASMAVIKQVIVAPSKDLGGFSVRRALPAIGTRMVGPFIFFDQFGPAEFKAGQGVDVRPHPHIGLSTVSYLFDGEMMHRDSLGTALAIKPGDVNLMTAGRGIVHSERTGEVLRDKGHHLHGIQAWLALPKAHEENAPSFAHHGVDALPRVDDGGKRIRVIMGALFGVESPVSFPHDVFYAEAVLSPGATLPLDADHEERAIYIVSGQIDIAGDTFEAGRLLVFRPGDRISVLAVSHARLMLLGGAAMDGPRHIWWNFVSSRQERIEQAKEEWRAARFDTVPGDAEEFIPLPA